MSEINIEAILNGTPVKRINNAHNKLVQEGLTESSAKNFFDVYSAEPLSAILECSREIFSEPYYGTSFYIEKVCTPNSCLFLSKALNKTGYESELEKVSTFIEEVKNKIPENQLALYEGIKGNLENLVEMTKATRVVAEYAEEINPGFNEKLTQAIYENNEDEIKNLFNENTVVEAITYFPYVSGTVGFDTNEALYESAKSFLITEKVDEENWDTHVKLVACGNKLITDKAYVEAMRSIPTPFREAIKFYCESSLQNNTNEMSKTKVSYIGGVDDPQVSVNNIFFAMQEAAMFAEDYEEKKERIRKIKKVAYETTSDLLEIENTLLENADEAKAEGYSLYSNHTTVSDLYAISSNDFASYYKESDDEDDDDVDDIDEEEVTPDRLGAGDPGKKIKAPEAKNLANKIQNKAMDNEVQHNKKKAIRKQKGQEIINAADAATRVPRQAIADVKATIRKLDEMDDERRKNYMTEPGFRKKAFRNLKLAILYGGAAYTKLTLVPVAMMARHFSKQKDRRMRNELIRELETEIKVCEEKINDANANEDKTEKYRLMRIRDRLSAELTRVQTNSKYI